MDKLLGQMKREFAQSQSQTSFAKDIFSASTTSSRNSKNIDDSAGEGWFNMKSSTMTSQLKRDIQILNLRKALNPIQHYKEAKIGKKHVQYGTVIETHYDRFSTGQGKKPKALIDQLLQDSQFSKQLHSKFLSIQQRRQMGLKPKKIPRK